MPDNKPTVFRVNVPTDIVREARLSGFPVVHRIGFILPTWEDEDHAINMSQNEAKFYRVLQVRTLVEQWVGKATNQEPKRERLRSHDGTAAAAFDSWSPSTRNFYAGAWKRHHNFSASEVDVLSRVVSPRGDRVVYTYKVPEALSKEFTDAGFPAISTIGFRPLTGEEEAVNLEAMRSNLDFMRLQTMAGLAEVDGKPVSAEAYKDWHPKARVFAMALLMLSEQKVMVKESFFEKNEEKGTLDD